LTVREQLEPKEGKEKAKNGSCEENWDRGWATAHTKPYGAVLRSVIVDKKEVWGKGTSLLQQ